MTAEHLKTINQGARVVEFRPGDILFHQGENAYCMFLIQSGQVVLETSGERPASEMVSVETLSKGDVIGWSWLIPPFSWNLQARALEPTKAIVIEGAHLLVNCEADPKFGYALMKRVAQLMAHRFQSVRKHLVVEHERNLQGDLLPH
jgi:CRP/FNR family transcriptional regulator, cyclic AMP receptor protein